MVRMPTHVWIVRQTGLAVWHVVVGYRAESGEWHGLVDWSASSRAMARRCSRILEAEKGLQSRSARVQGLTVQ